MRNTIFLVLAFLLVFTGAFAFLKWLSWFWFILLVFLSLLGIYDSFQKKHTILRNFPVIGHLRYLLEMLRPEIKQYFIESNITEYPIARIYRSLVYEEAKGVLETVPFGSELDQYASDYKWVNHSCFPTNVTEEDFRVTIGNKQCSQPYSASLFNISAMSFGSISNAAITALGRGAKAGNFFHNTGEGGLSPYHLETGADLVWQLGTAYFGARDKRGYFDPVLFREKSVHPHMKMIEIKISQGAKPGHGGILPGVKVDKEIADIRKVEIGKTVISPPGHTAFTNPKELCLFIQQLRELCGGKPVGFKLCLGRREEFLKICEAMLELKIYPDFITVDGGEGGTGAAPFDFLNFVGSPLKEALYFADHTLKQYELREHIKLIASGKVFSGFNLFEKLALGADLCNSARGMMLALGCIQAYRCNTNKCPVGIATTDASLIAGLDITDKAQRVMRFHRKTILSLGDLIAAVGLHCPDDVGLKHISCRQDGQILTLAELFEGTKELSTHEEHDRKIKSQGEPKAPTPPKED